MLCGGILSAAVDAIKIAEGVVNYLYAPHETPLLRVIPMKAISMIDDCH
jgi:hypothetical protein